MVKEKVREKEKIKILTIVILLGISCFLTYYFHIVLKTAVIFTHFFYIPIILACIWWERKVRKNNWARASKNKWW